MKMENAHLFKQETFLPFGDTSFPPRHRLQQSPPNRYLNIADVHVQFRRSAAAMSAMFTRYFADVQNSTGGMFMKKS